MRLVEYQEEAFNPAVAIGISLIEMASWNNIWVYVVGCFGGRCLSRICIRINNPDDK